MNDVRGVHEIHSFTDLHHVQFTQTFSENEIIVDYTFEQFATGDSTKERTDRRKKGGGRERGYNSMIRQISALLSKAS